jgi:gliding motility-associated-like protein
MRLVFRYITLFLILISFTAKSQLVTSGNQSPAALVQNVLVGPGVSVSNVSYSGTGMAIGYFNSENANVGLAEGIILTTGTIHNTTAFGSRQGPQGPNDTGSAGVDNNQPGYPLLNGLVTGTATTYNAAVLEFDFIPLADKVEFRYVFGSEEYPEFVGSEYNDVFGFFISGPGIAGRQNIALIPETTQPVAINNVNAGQNSNYFVGNGNGTQAPYNASNQYVQYDGLTTVLTASSNVQCGQTYHIILAIADVGDGRYDSGIFLEANSLSSPVLVDVSYQLSSLSFDNNYTMAEGCTEATIRLTRFGDDLSGELTIPISVSGTATMGVDYSNVPTSITFAPNQTQVSFTIEAFADAIIEGIETIELSFNILNPCGEVVPTIINLAIDDVAEVTAIVDDIDVNCEGDMVTLNVIPSGGGDGYTYSWNTGATTQSINVAPLVTTTYTVSVTDNCLNQTYTTQAEVNVVNYPPLELSASSDVSDPCPYREHILFAEFNGGAGGTQFMWVDNLSIEYGNQLTQLVTPSVSTLYYIHAEDRCGERAIDSVMVTITSPPLIPSILGDTTICKGDSALFTASAIGGWGDYFYYWPHNETTMPSSWITPLQSTEIQVIVSDDCQTFTAETTGNVQVQQPLANFSVLSSTLFEGLPIHFQNTSYLGTSYFWEFGDGSTSTNMHPNNTYNTHGTYIINLYVEDDLGCRDSISKALRILTEFYIYVPNAITPNGNGINDVFYASTVNVVEFEMLIFNRWGELIFTANNDRFYWDGTYKGEFVQDGIYPYIIKYTSINDDEGTINGHVTVIR